MHAYRRHLETMFGAYIARNNIVFIEALLTCLDWQPKKNVLLSELPGQVLHPVPSSRFASLYISFLIRNNVPTNMTMR